MVQAGARGAACVWEWVHPPGSWVERAPEGWLGCDHDPQPPWVACLQVAWEEAAQRFVALDPDSCCRGPLFLSPPQLDHARQAFGTDEDVCILSWPPRLFCQGPATTQAGSMRGKQATALVAQGGEGLAGRCLASIG